jgi:hypothetical protein
MKKVWRVDMAKSNVGVNKKGSSRSSLFKKTRILSKKTTFKYFKDFLRRNRHLEFEDVYALFFKQLKSKQWAQNIYEQFKRRESDDSPTLNQGHQHDDVWFAFNQLYLWDRAELNGQNLWRPRIVAIYTGEGADSVNSGEPFSLKSGRSSPDSGFKDGDSRPSSAMGSSFLSQGDDVDAVKRKEDHSQYTVIGGGHEESGKSVFDDVPQDYLDALSGDCDSESPNRPVDVSSTDAPPSVSSNISCLFNQCKDNDLFAKSSVKASEVPTMLSPDEMSELVAAVVPSI